VRFPIKLFFFHRVLSLQLEGRTLIPSRILTAVLSVMYVTSRIVGIGYSNVASPALWTLSCLLPGPM
jgi:hypothetical protein